ncbi:MAG: amidophosphoribosyltransferase [Candidatus Aenigmarchaeota archaeon]|nr:amidophosphoribosyltransferase [Candidatus Aenigmarchaeota archaeon]
MKKESCGVFGVFSSDEDQTSNIIYNGLLSLQHRGQEANGIAILNGSEICLKKFTGLVTDTLSPLLLSKMKGNTGIGHVRYSTVGKSRLTDAQPFQVNYPKHGIVLAHNGNLVNYMDLRKELIDSGRNLISTSDAEILINILSEELAESKDIEDAVLGLMERVEGAYSITSFTGDGELIVFRDPYGFKPLCYGGNDNMRAFASESVALEVNKARLKSDVKPGQLIITDKNGKSEKRQVVSCKNAAHCMFEYVYFSRPDSILDGKCVYDVRVKLGENLAKTYSSDADVIVPVPDTSRPAAEGISRVTGIPVAEGLIKNRYIFRTFIMPSQKMRDQATNLKLNPIKSVLKDKRVILVDDSIVRGTTSNKIVKLVKSAGPKSVDVWITCPPIISPCFYGIDIATHGELIAANNTVPEIEKIIGADNLCYQKKDCLIDAIGHKRSDLCMACLTGEYPTPLAQKIADRMKNQTSLKRIRYWERETS